MIPMISLLLSWLFVVIAPAFFVIDLMVIHEGVYVERVPAVVPGFPPKTVRVELSDNSDTPFMDNSIYCWHPPQLSVTNHSLH